MFRFNNLKKYVISIISLVFIALAMLFTDKNIIHNIKTSSDGKSESQTHNLKDSINGEDRISLTAKESAWLQEHPVISVAEDPSWPPVEFTNKRGERSGISNDYLNIIEKRLGNKFEVVHNLSWQEQYVRLQRREIDMTTSVTESPERKKFWAFTNPYLKIPIVIIVQENVSYIASMNELLGKKVAVVEGYVIVEFLSRDFPGIQLVKVKNVEDGFSLLQSGEVFCYIENMLVTGYYLTKLKAANLKVGGTTPYENALAMAVRKDWAILADILQKALNSISEEQRAQIYSKWVPVRYEYGFNYGVFWRVLAISALILIGLIIWNRNLSKEINHRKKTDAEREALIAELESKNSELERFTYTVSHDLKSPLITIKGFLGMLKEDSLSGDMTQLSIDIKHISDAADRMKQLLEDLSQLSKIGRFTIQPELMSLTELTKEAIDTLSSVIAKRNVQIDIPLDLPEIYVDRTRFLQVLINLIDNSIKFMGEQTDPRIRIGSKKINGEDVFIVADNGMGIDSHYLERVFKLFEKMEPKSPGTGIGLTIAKKIIDMFGGKIWAESEGIGKGTTFFFTLPVK